MHKNTVSHFEIYAKNPEKLSHFYTSLFDWKVTARPEIHYHLVSTVETNGQGMAQQPGGINGGIAETPDGFTINGSVNYTSVDSIEQSVEKAIGLGAKVTKSKTAVPGMGWFAMMIDPEGNNFAVWKADPDAR